MKKNNFKKKILIIGGGRAGRRFCEALIFKKKFDLLLSSLTSHGKTKKITRKFNLDFKLFNKLSSEDLEDISTIIISTPPGTKLKILKKIVDNKYTGPIIFEKPLSISSLRIKKISNILFNHRIKFLVAYPRRFFTKKLKSSAKFKTISIEWPYFLKDKIDPIIHILPHILDTVLLVYKKTLVFEDYKKDKHHYIISGKTGKRNFLIRLFGTKDKNALAIFNGKEMPWPNHFIIYPRMIERVKKIKRSEARKIINDSLNISLILNKIYSKRNEKTINRQTYKSTR